MRFSYSRVDLNLHFLCVLHVERFPGKLPTRNTNWATINTLQIHTMDYRGQSVRMSHCIECIQPWRIHHFLNGGDSFGSAPPLHTNKHTIGSPRNHILNHLACDIFRMHSHSSAKRTKLFHKQIQQICFSNTLRCAYRVDRFAKRSTSNVYPCNVNVCICSIPHRNQISPYKCSVCVVLSASKRGWTRRWFSRPPQFDDQGVHDGSFV